MLATKANTAHDTNKQNMIYLIVVLSLLTSVMYITIILQKVIDTLMLPSPEPVPTGEWI